MAFLLNSKSRQTGCKLRYAAIVCEARELTNFSWDTTIMNEKKISQVQFN